MDDLYGTVMHELPTEDVSLMEKYIISHNRYFDYLSITVRYTALTIKNDIVYFCLDYKGTL